MRRLSRSVRRRAPTWSRGAASPQRRFGLQQKTRSGKLAVPFTMYGPPVDLSFNQISRLTDALRAAPRSGLRPSTRTPEGKHRSRSLWLGNNAIKELDGLPAVLERFLAEPSALGWLDLSFNQLTSVSWVLGELRELRVLYLHGNDISALTEVEKLATLPHLHTLTLHGNAVEQRGGYRSFVISRLPCLKKLDFSTVTPEERELARIWVAPSQMASDL